MTVFINEQATSLPEGSTLLDALQHEGCADKQGIAVALDQSVQPRDTWASTALRDQSQILIIQATQGG